jgi:hypothetical protein
MRRLVTNIPDTLYEQIAKAAAAENRTVSNLVSYLLERAMENRGVKNDK